jgi:hypothetical protein
VLRDSLKNILQVTHPGKSNFPPQVCAKSGNKRRHGFITSKPIMKLSEELGFFLSADHLSWIQCIGKQTRF